ncbi:MAG: MTAP family purine nucleoside phosphorylase [Microthrixaceae bacterium]
MAHPPGLHAAVAVIGGSGFYDIDGAATYVEVETPWGLPSAPIAIAGYEGCPVAFLSRHGVDHRLPPHAVDSRANLWALRSIGVRSVVGAFACGSLVSDLGPGQLVAPDQLIDQTNGRHDTVHDTFADGPQHAGFADPYDSRVRRAVLDAGHACVEDVRDGSTVVVINGPRFATRAESRWYRSMGAHLVNMTQYPETVIARELELGYAAIGLVTDFDAGLDDRPDLAPVDQHEVFRVFAAHLPRLRRVALAAAAALA